MDKKGFTLVELLATLVVLGIVVGITIVGVNGGFGNAKQKTEDIFIKTIEDALAVYIDSDAKKVAFNNESVCNVDKRFGSVKVYKNKNTLTFNNVMNSEYVPLVDSEFVNPAKENVSCNKAAPISIYRDEDYVYYYKIAKSDLVCLTIDNEDNSKNYITNLPSGCDE